MELVSLAKNPVPSGAIVGTLRSFDGTALRYAVWQASRKPRRGTVCLFGGRTEYIEKYFEIIADLRRRGLAVATMDWRGQGGSARPLNDPRKGHVEDFDRYDQDLVRFMREIVLPDCPPPYTALAHSMGGNILLRAARMRGSWFDKMVLVAPMIRMSEVSLGYSERTVRLFARLSTLVGFASAYSPGGSATPSDQLIFEGNVLTSDRERFNRNKAIIEAAPDLSLGSPTNGWLWAAIKSMDSLQAEDYARSVRVPLLLVAAGADKVVVSRAIEDLAARVKVGAHILVPHSEHEIMQERDEFRLQFLAAFDAYVGVD